MGFACASTQSAASAVVESKSIQDTPNGLEFLFDYEVFKEVQILSHYEYFGDL